MNPTIGRIVHYGIDGRVFAAVITRVAYGFVSLQVFFADTDGEQRIIAVPNAIFEEMSGPPRDGRWAWPPRVP